MTPHLQRLANRQNGNLHIYFGIMKNECFKPEAPSAACTTILTAVWRVDAGSSYDNARSIAEDTLIAVRTLTGEGEIERRGFPKLIVKSGTLILIHQKDLLRYRCSGSRWGFFWFKFTATGVLPLPINQLFEFKSSSKESAERKHICQEIRHSTAESARLASARFGTLLCLWSADAGAIHEGHPHHRRIERVVEEMRQHLDGKWTVKSMAHTAGFSERRFRQVFFQITGTTPKSFYDELRLKQAYELLWNGVCNVSETAEQLGFSSPFHFSKAFKNHYGKSPSAVYLH